MGNIGQQAAISLAGVRAEIGQQAVFVAAVIGNGRIGGDVTGAQHQLLDQNVNLI